MSYTPPDGDAANLSWAGAPTYSTAPSGDAANLTWQTGVAPDDVVGTGAITLPVTVAGAGTHAVGGAGAITLPIAVAGAGVHYTGGAGAVTLPISVAGAGTHGVGGSISIALPISVAGAGAQGVAGAGAIRLGISVAGSGAHGVAGAGSVSVPITVAGVAVHQRYELRGEVRLGGVLVNRRVRAYSRDTGVLLGEADTIAGKFRVHAGFAEIECYATPIDLSPGAVDWLPPTANRILAVLASDTA